MTSVRTRAGRTVSSAVTWGLGQQRCSVKLFTACVRLRELTLHVGSHTASKARQDVKPCLLGTRSTISSIYSLKKYLQSLDSVPDTVPRCWRYRAERAPSPPSRRTRKPDWTIPNTKQGSMRVITNQALPHYHAPPPSKSARSHRHLTSMSPGEGNGYALQYSRLENPMDRGAWRVTVPGVTKNQTRLSN